MNIDRINGRKIIIDVHDIVVKETKKFIDDCYYGFCDMEMGDSYIVIDGKRISIDTGYAFEGIELFVKYMKEKLSL